MGRRGFLELSTAAAIGGAGGVEQVADDAVGLNDNVQTPAVLVGPRDNRPSPTGAYVSQFATGPELVYITLAGERFRLNGGGGEWEYINTVPAAYAAGSLPSDPPAGSLFWNETRGTQTVYDGDDYEVPVIGDAQLTETQTVENTTAEETVFSTDLTAGSMVDGRVYEVGLYGGFTTNDGSDTFTIRLYLAGQEVSATTSVAEQVSDAPITVRFYLTVRSSGESGSVVTHTEAVFDDVHSDTEPGTNPITVDTTVANSIMATVEWGVAEAGDVVEITQGYLKEVT